MSWNQQQPYQNPYMGGGSGGYGAPPQGGYGGYGAPSRGPNAPPHGGYGAPAGGPGGYGAPSAPPGGYGRPQGGYGGGYGAPQNFPPPGVSPELWGWFQAVDTDHSGKITAQELQQALVNGNWSPFNSETCRLMISMFDRNHDGTINAEEFAALWKYIQDWKACFDRFDTDRSGNINASELNSAFRTFGYNLSPNFCSLIMRVFNRYDRNSINFDDFIQCCVMLKGLTDAFRQRDPQQKGVIQVHYEDFLKMALDHI